MQIQVKLKYPFSERVPLEAVRWLYPKLLQYPGCSRSGALRREAGNAGPPRSCQFSDPMVWHRECAQTGSQVPECPEQNSCALCPDIWMPSRVVWLYVFLDRM